MKKVILYFKNLFKKKEKAKIVEMYNFQMKDDIIEKLNLSEAIGYWFGNSFIYDVKCYYFFDDIYCALSNENGSPNFNGIILFWRTGEFGFCTKASEDFIRASQIEHFKSLFPQKGNCSTN